MLKLAEVKWNERLKNYYRKVVSREGTTVCGNSSRGVYLIENRGFVRANRESLY